MEASLDISSCTSRTQKGVKTIYKVLSRATLTILGPTASEEQQACLRLGPALFLIVISFFTIFAALGAATCYAMDQDPNGAMELIYFFSPQCPRCQRVEEFLHALSREYAGQIYITKYDMSTPDGESFRQAMNSQFEVAESMTLAVPAVFFGKPLIGEANITAYLESEIISALVSGRQAVASEPMEQMNRLAIISQAESLAWVPIILAGALDGVNPCAFSMLMFLVVTLSLTKGQLRVFITGFTFCLAAFITNLSIGLGVISLSSTASLASVARTAYLIGGIVALVVGIGSLMDSWRSKGKLHTAHPVLGMPKPLRNLSKGIIRRWNEGNLFILYPFLAFATGIVVALFEFPCTGQVYLPTIAFMLGNPHYRYRATMYLVLYNLMYILPLVAVLILSIWLMNPRRVARYFGGRIYIVKGMTGCFLIALGVYMLIQHGKW